MRRLMALVVLLCGAASASANDRIFVGYSAESILSACTARETGNYGFCLGFIYAIAYDLSVQKKSCAFALANLDPVLQAAVDALSRTKGKLDQEKASNSDRLNTDAWPIIEDVLVDEWPPERCN